VAHLGARAAEECRIKESPVGAEPSKEDVLPAQGPVQRVRRGREIGGSRSPHDPSIARGIDSDVLPPIPAAPSEISRVDEVPRFGFQSHPTQQTSRCKRELKGFPGPVFQSVLLAL
jgi:hypothetical protein